LSASKEIYALFTGRGEGGSSKKGFGKNKKEGSSDMDLIEDHTGDFLAKKLY
jgi:hypothetical protein